MAVAEKVLQVCITEKEKELLKEMAWRSKLSTSKYVRDLLTGVMMKEAELLGLQDDYDEIALENMESCEEIPIDVLAEQAEEYLEKEGKQE